MHPNESDDKSRLTAETMGRRLASRRALRGLSQEEAGSALGVTRQYVSMLENDVHVPSTELLIKLAQLYRVSLDWLVYGDAPSAAAV
jgi:transcriptional regulator with XRE-family HTH domain